MKEPNIGGLSRQATPASERPRSTMRSTTRGPADGYRTKEEDPGECLKDDKTVH